MFQKPPRPSPTGISLELVERRTPTCHRLLREPAGSEMTNGGEALPAQPGADLRAMTVGLTAPRVHIHRASGAQQPSAAGMRPEPRPSSVDVPTNAAGSTRLGRVQPGVTQRVGRAAKKGIGTLQQERKRLDRQQRAGRWILTLSARGAGTVPTGVRVDVRGGADCSRKARQIRSRTWPRADC